MAASSRSDVIARARAALQNGLVADALSMPVHWFYNPGDILRLFGDSGIRQFEAAPRRHPSSIMNLHSTKAGGRWSAGGGSGAGDTNIVGDVILKGRKHLWNVPNAHYHHGLQAGENTLNADCARLVTRLLADHRLRYSADDFLDAYIAFMQGESTYRDTYAESFHRDFFLNLVVHGKPRHQCGKRGHDTPSIGAFVMLVPVALATLLRDPDVAAAQQVARAFLQLTHPDAGLAAVSDQFVWLIARLLYRTADEDPRHLVEQVFDRVSPVKGLPALLKKAPHDAKIVGGTFSIACYIDGSFPSALYLAYKYGHPDSVLDGLLANTNLGGENCHRGYVVGALLGLITATPVSSLYPKLAQFDAIDQEIQRFCDIALNQD